ncbi:MAG: hypothetical protein IJ958_03865 [Agathobacter sp.]|nr:hypothetical protein [Agathobacter sp.]
MVKNKYASGELAICPMATSKSKEDQYKDICKITNFGCPFYDDEGMSVCKSKTKCIQHFKRRIKKGKKINHSLMIKLLFSKV